MQRVGEEDASQGVTADAVEERVRGERPREVLVDLVDDRGERLRGRLGRTARRFSARQRRRVGGAIVRVVVRSVLLLVRVDRRRSVSRADARRRVPRRRRRRRLRPVLRVIVSLSLLLFRRRRLRG